MWVGGGNAVALALQTWPDKTQQAIADQVGCSQGLVHKVKDQLIMHDKLTIPETRVGADGKERPTTYQKKEPEEVNITTDNHSETETTAGGNARRNRLCRHSSR